MSSDKIFLNKTEQIFLMEMLEIKDPEEAVFKFAAILVEEKVDSRHLMAYLKKIMARLK